MRLRELDQRSHPFLGLYFALLIPTIALLILFGKGQIHLFINRFHSPAADQFFKLATHLGDPLFLLAVALMLLLRDWRKSLLLGVNTALCGGVVSLIKAILIDDMRPFKFFQYFNAPLHFVEGIRLHEYNTFPSGHTALAFGTFFLLSVFAARKTATVVFFFLAVLVGYSRMYLSMHFLIDVTVGSVLGLIIAITLYLFSHTSRGRKLVRLPMEQERL